MEWIRKNSISQVNLLKFNSDKWSFTGDENYSNSMERFRNNRR